MATEASHVILGTWTNYNGTTYWNSEMLTMTRGQWLFFNNALVVFITIAAERFWWIISYFLHQCGSHTDPRDGLRRSTEIYLKNLPNISTAFNLMFLIHYWKRKVSSGTFFKTLLILLLAWVNLVGFQAAAIFVPQITFNSMVRLKSSETCGIYRVKLFNELAPVIANMGQLIDSELRKLPKEDLEGKSDTLVQTTSSSSWFTRESSNPGPQFHISHDYLKYSPFNETMVLPKEKYPLADPVYIDSGNISLRDFGLNTPEDITVQHRAECAVLNTRDNQYRNWRMYEVDKRKHKDYYVSRYLFGETDKSGSKIRSITNGVNWDSWNVLEETHSEARMGGEGNDTLSTFEYQYAPGDPIYRYGLHAESWPQNVDNFRYNKSLEELMMNKWKPIEQFNSSDPNEQDLSIIFFIKNAMLYSHAQSDPVFEANDRRAFSESESLYQGNYQEPVAAVGCKQFIRFCNTGANATCSAFGGQNMFKDPTQIHTDLHFSELQSKLAKSYIVVASQWHRFANLAVMRREQILLANKRQWHGVSVSLSNQQWVLELKNMMRFSLVGTLNEFKQYAAGQSAEIYKEATGNALERLPNLPDQKEDPICLGNMVLADAPLTHVTVLFRPALFVIVGGGIIIFLSWWLDFLVEFILKFWPSGEAKVLAWKADDQLQLYRLATESVGVDQWELKSSKVLPVAKKNTKMPTVVSEGGWLRLVATHDSQEIMKNYKGKYVGGAYRFEDNEQVVGVTSSSSNVSRLSQRTLLEPEREESPERESLRDPRKRSPGPSPTPPYSRFPGEEPV